MNNIKYFNDNLAHDYDRFMPKANRKEQAEKVIKMTPKKQPKASKKSSNAKAFPIVMSIIIVAAIFGNLFLRAEISRVGNELSAAETVTERLKSEQTRLSVELEKKTSVGNLEKQAIGLGMQKQEKSQMNYIFTYEDEFVEESADAE